jgi:hypothetical protein
MSMTLPGFAALQLSFFNATPFAVTREAKCLQDISWIVCLRAGLREWIPHAKEN